MTVGPISLRQISAYRLDRGVPHTEQIVLAIYEVNRVADEHPKSRVRLTKLSVVAPSLISRLEHGYKKLITKAWPRAISRVTGSGSATYAHA